ncbi:hypothetical protein ACSQ67_012921 [Phaseolus vulgaris]
MEQNQSRSLVRSKVSLAHVIQQAEGQRSGWSKRKAVSIAEKLEQENLFSMMDHALVHKLGDWSQDQEACYAGKHQEQLGERFLAKLVSIVTDSFLIDFSKLFIKSMHCAIVTSAIIGDDMDADIFENCAVTVENSKPKTTGTAESGLMWEMSVYKISEVVMQMEMEMLWVRSIAICIACI